MLIQYEIRVNLFSMYTILALSASVYVQFVQLNLWNFTSLDIRVKDSQEAWNVNKHAIDWYQLNR
jgi:hypothetical protein